MDNARVSVRALLRTKVRAPSLLFLLDYPFPRLPAMARVCRSVLLLLLCATPHLRAASSAENRAFDAALGAFNGTFWERAEKEFGEFAQTFTNSTHLGQARLYQARARLNLTNYAGALELLGHLPGPTDRLNDQYLFWTAETLFEKGDYRGAADGFARMVREFPTSPQRLEAALREAFAASRVQDWPRVLQLETNAVFQAGAQTNAAGPLVVRAYLLLAHANLALTNYAAAERNLKPLTQVALEPQSDWERQDLLCRIFAAEGRLLEALNNTTNLLAAATATGQLPHVADAAAFQAGLLEGLGRPADAITSYQRNLAEGIPPERQRQALLKIAELSVAQNQLPEATLTLERFCARYTNAPAVDVALVTLGELRLRQYEQAAGTNQFEFPLTNSPAGTNLFLALSALETFTNKWPRSPWLGRAELYLGWCFWIEQKWPESRTAFQLAAERLPPLSSERAMALFKLADTELRQSNPAGATTNLAAAISNYTTLTEQFRGNPEVQTNLFEPALYQLASAALKAGDFAAASNAVWELLAWYPNGFYTDRAVLLRGQAVGQNNPGEARQLFEAFLAAVKDAKLRPQVELARARTFEQEGRWSDAVQAYDGWLNIYTNQPEQAQAEFYRAWANSEAGHLTNALTQFTNLVARFPANDFAPKAQWWVADYFFNQSDWEGAEKNFQAVFQNPKSPPDLANEAIMMAGRVAFARQGWEDARRYFSLITNNTNCVPQLRAQAYLAYGDLLVSRDSTNKLADFRDALAAYNQVGSVCPNSALAILALGSRANCCLQSQDYEGATNAYLQVIAAPTALADAAVRSGAKVGLAITLEKMSQQPTLAESVRLELLSAALDHGLDVFYYAHFLRDGEKPDLFWTVKAGQTAGHLLTETLLKQRPDSLRQALHVYEQVQQLFPALPLDNKINTLKNQLQALTQVSE